MSDILEKMKGFMKNSVDIDFRFGESVPCGGSKFGGRPDVPEGFEWAVYNDMPLSFIAQFDLSEVSAYDKDGILPKEGVLSFFYELESMEWGFDPKTEGCARVYYFPPETKLSPAPFPEELEEEYRLPEAKAVMSSKMFYPDPSNYEDDEYVLTDEEIDEYFDAYEEISDEYPARINKLLGHPNLIQDSIPLECELVSRGIYTGSGNPTITEEMKKAAKEWVLLFQLDSFDNDDCGLMFGDDGRIYWYIKKDDLANKRFDKAHLVLQCY